MARGDLPVGPGADAWYSSLWRNLSLEDDPEAGDLLPLRKGGNGLELAVPNALRAVGRALALPGQVLQGEVDPMSPEGKARTAEMALTLAGTGRGMTVPEGTSLGVFAGRRAATADRAALARAMNMEGRKPPEEIWNKTGWFRDVDGHWKWEIPDTGSVVTPKSGKLPDMLEHPNLFKAYPQLANVGAKVTPEQGLGAYHPGDQTIAVSPLQHPTNFHSTVLHETQHAIQDIEGFAEGGSPAEFLPPNFSLKYVQALQDYRSLKNEIRGHGIDPDRVQATLTQMGAGQEVAPEYASHFNELGAVNMPLLEHFITQHQVVQNLGRQQNVAFDQYNRLAGEVEARNVQERWEHDLSSPMLLPPKEGQPLAARQAVTAAPWQTPGYTPRGEQIVRGGTLQPGDPRYSAPRSDADFIAGLPAWLRQEHYHLDSVEGDPFSESSP